MHTPEKNILTKQTITITPIKKEKKRTRIPKTTTKESNNKLDNEREREVVAGTLSRFGGPHVEHCYFLQFLLCDDLFVFPFCDFFFG